jgi:hypothetical protein
MTKRNMIQTYVWLTPPMRAWLDSEHERTGQGLSELVRELVAREMLKRKVKVDPTGEV